MANLTRRWSWKKWAPDIGENRELEGGPVLWLELAVGLTGAQMVELGAQLKKARDLQYVPPPKPVRGEFSDEDFAAALKAYVVACEAAFKVYLGAIRAVFGAALEPYVRVFEGPHTVDGQQLATLDDYLRIVEEAADYGVHARTELEAALASANSMEGHDELFLLRSSGGARTTAPRRTGKTAAR
ncbi:MAG: hypothetical protein WC700_18680 [Gemmatimonadaceae bacterium]|jgi:hypothetical protein